MRNITQREFQRGFFSLLEGTEVLCIRKRGGKVMGYFLPPDVGHQYGLMTDIEDGQSEKESVEAVIPDVGQTPEKGRTSEIGVKSEEFEEVDVGHEEVDVGHEEVDVGHEEEKCMKCKRGIVGRVGQGETAEGSFEEIRICEFCWMKAGSPKWYKKI